MSEADEKVRSFQQPEDAVILTPRQLLMRVLQDADELSSVIIIAQRKDDPTALASGRVGQDNLTAIGMLEVTKQRFLKLYHRISRDEL